MDGVKAITGTEFNALMSEWEEKKVPKGRYIAEYDGKFHGIDNSTGDFWVESFQSYTACLLWVRG